MTSDLTKLLLAHRAARTTVDALPPELVPADMDAAYAIQDETLAELGPVGAWKVSPVPENGTLACSPLPMSYIHPSGVRLAHADLSGLGIEVEVAVTLGRDLTGEATLDDVRTAIATVHPALELISSRYADRRAVSQPAAFADLQSSGGIVLGAPKTFAQLPQFATQAMTLTLDGAEAAATHTGPSTENLLSAITWLAHHAAARGKPLTAGTVIITGARLGPVAFSGTDAQADLPGLGSVSASFS